MRVLVLHGPNLGLLGLREPSIYGTEGLAEIDGRLTALAAELGIEVECRQSNHEGVLLDWIAEAAPQPNGAPRRFDAQRRAVYVQHREREPRDVLAAQERATGFGSRAADPACGQQDLFEVEVRAGRGSRRVRVKEPRVHPRATIDQLSATHLAAHLAGREGAEHP